MSAELSGCSLHAGYGKRSVLHGVDISLRSGDLAALIGPNGSGKSTLLRCLSGELHPQSGQVRLDGVLLNRLPVKARARRIAVLPQRPTLAPSQMSQGVSATDVVLMGRYARMGLLGLASRRDRQAVLEALDAVDALPLAERDAAELSGGELQRVFLARALAQEADILLLDEPAGAMDPAHTADLFHLLARQSAQGKAVLAVLHDVNAAALFCTRVLALRQGTLLFDQASGILTSQQLSDLYDTPFHAFPHPTAPVPQFCLYAPGPQDMQPTRAAASVPGRSGGMPD